ncbi:MAG: hypothetical protein QOF65_3105 [Thermoleophilaceae bacterium]|nr:hypothetical protein [Thermoleophilaceae bacterium]
MPRMPDGLVLAPFRALRYDARTVGDLAAVLSPPYDVIDAAARERLEATSPYNVVRLILPRGPETGPHSRYAEAARTLTNWRNEGVLVADAEPALYVYEESQGEHVQRGLVGALGLVPFDDGVVLPHENVMAGPVADRLALMTATEANLEPIFCVYDGGGAATEIAAEAADGDPLADVATSDGTRHRLWAITKPQLLAAVAADLRPRRAVIADGHHRYTTYLHMQDERRAAGSGPGPWDYGLTLLDDALAFGPQVHAIHRVIRDLDVGRAARVAETTFKVRHIDRGIGAALGELEAAGKTGPAFVVTDGTSSYLLTEPDPKAVTAALPKGRSEAWRSLDVTVAHHLLIKGVWGLADTEEGVGYAHDVEEALAQAAAVNGIALLLNPTPVEAVAAIAAEGDRMPRKSTLFTPKPQSGLLLRTFDTE